MKDELYAWDSRSMESKRKMPREWFYEDRDEKREAAKAEARKTVRGEDVVVLGDADADGLGGVAAVREFYDEDVAFVSCGPHGSDMYLGDALWVCVDELEDGATVIVQDIAVPDADWKVKMLPQVAETAGEILWFDHHEYDDEVREFVAEHVDHLELDDGVDDAENDVYEARCAAMMLRDYYVEQGYEFSEQFLEAMDVTGEYDLWRLRDDRCFDLNDLTHVVDDDEYVALVRKHGADVMNDDEVAELVAEYREEQTTLHDMAIENVERYQIGEWVVATVYGNCPTNDVAETLRERGLADVVVFATPHGGLSLRGSENFKQCHIVAGKFDGGGHAKSAGAGLYDEFTEDLDYANHWATEGEAVIGKVICEFEALADAEAEASPEAVEPAD